MKTVFLVFFILTLLALDVKAGAPYGFKGQQQTATQYKNVLQFPNNQITNLGGINALVESGNNNLLSNPSFETVTANTSWTDSGTETGIGTAVAVIHGKRALAYLPSAEAISLVQSSTLYQAQFADGVQGLAMCRIKSDVALKVCSVQAGTVSTTNCVDTKTDSKWGLYKVPFILGATSNGVSIAGSGLTGTVVVDDCFVGAVDLKQDVDQSRIAGESYFLGTASCNTSRTSTTLGSFTPTAACPGPTIVSGAMGSWQTTDADLIKQTINDLPAGKYEASFSYFATPGTASLNYSHAITDGTTTCQEQGPTGTTAGENVTLTCVFDYASSGNRSFEIVGRSSSSSTLVYNDAGTGYSRSSRFILKYFGASSVYTAQNADTDWASCGHTTSDFTGFGTVSAIETQCKRDGGDLLMKGKFTSGTSTAVEARLALRFNSGALTSKSTSVIPTIQQVGNSSYNVMSAIQGVTLIEPSTTYMTFGLQGAANAGLTKALGNAILASTNILTFTARIPINGWENSNVIIGTFSEMVSSPGVSRPKTCHYAFGGASATLASPVTCSTGTCVEVYDSCNAGTPPAFSSAGYYLNTTFANGTWANSSYIDCRCKSFSATVGAVSDCDLISETGDQTWATNSSGGYVAGSTFSTNQSGTSANAYVQVICTGQAP
jgi:hypothetical protein